MGCYGFEEGEARREMRKLEATTRQTESDCRDAFVRFGGVGARS